MAPGCGASCHDMFFNSKWALRLLSPKTQRCRHNKGVPPGEGVEWAITVLQPGGEGETLGRAHKGPSGLFKGVGNARSGVDTPFLKRPTVTEGEYPGHMCLVNPGKRSQNRHGASKPNASTPKPL